MTPEQKQHSTQEWLDKTETARWVTLREESRMGKSGYAPKKAQLAEWVVEARSIMLGLYEQLEALRDEQENWDLFLQRNPAVIDQFVRWREGQAVLDSASVPEGSSNEALQAAINTGDRTGSSAQNQESDPASGSNDD